MLYYKKKIGEKETKGCEAMKFSFDFFVSYPYDIEAIDRKKQAFKETVKYLKFIPHFEVTEKNNYIYSCPKCGAMRRLEKAPALLKKEHCNSVLGGRHHECKVCKWDAAGMVGKEVCTV